MNLNPGTRTLLVALTVAGSALVAPAMALAETPAPEGPIGPVDVANPIDEPEPEPCDDPSDCTVTGSGGTATATASLSYAPMATFSLTTFDDPPFCIVTP
jgi:hypothetical protein